MNNDREKINKFIALEVCGLPCWHEISDIPWEGKRRMPRCLHCGIALGNNPDYFSPSAPRCLLDGARDRAIERVDSRWFLMKLIEVTGGKMLGEDQGYITKDNCFLAVNARPDQIAEAIYLACKPENQEVENA